MKILDSSLPYVYGEQFKRGELHKAFGGSFRHGMTIANHGNDFLLFHDEINSKKFGYDMWEGLQVDGSFHYTGQGKIGNQKMIRANSALINADRNAIPIHLIESKKGTCTYMGQYILDDPPFFVEKAPDANGKIERDVFVFKLLPIQENSNEIKPADLKEIIVGVANPWKPPAYESVILSGESVKRNQLDRIENELQAEFGAFLISMEHEVSSYHFSFAGLRGALRPDFWVPCLGLVVEAKPSSTREYIRLAIGQVLDYVNLSKLAGDPMKPAILVPNMPTADLCTLIYDLGITLISKKSDNEFVFISPQQTH